MQGVLIPSLARRTAAEEALAESGRTLVRLERLRDAGVTLLIGTDSTAGISSKENIAKVIGASRHVGPCISPMSPSDTPRCSTIRAPRVHPAGQGVRW